jgi:hypothetical protein
VEYIYLLDADKKERFEKLTRWYSNLIRKESTDPTSQNGARYDKEIKNDN